MASEERLTLIGILKAKKIIDRKANTSAWIPIGRGFKDSNGNRRFRLDSSPIAQPNDNDQNEIWLYEFPRDERNTEDSQERKKRTA